MKPIVFHEEAEGEFRAAIDYYETRRPDLGMDFQSEVESKTWSIRSDPERHPYYRNSGARRCLI